MKRIILILALFLTACNNVLVPAPVGFGEHKYNEFLGSFIYECKYDQESETLILKGVIISGEYSELENGYSLDSFAAEVVDCVDKEILSYVQVYEYNFTVDKMKAPFDESQITYRVTPATENLAYITLDGDGFYSGIVSYERFEIGY